MNSKIGTLKNCNFLYRNSLNFSIKILNNKPTEDFSCELVYFSAFLIHA